MRQISTRLRSAESPAIADGDGGDAWTAVRARLAARLGEPAVASWFRGARLDVGADGVATLTLPSRVARARAAEQYAHAIEASVRAEYPAVRRLVIVAAAAAPGAHVAAGGAPWPDPDMRLVDNDRAPPPELDDDALPAGWAPWIRAEAEACACPPDYVAAALIGAASGWIGHARRIAATSRWTEPAHLWFALIGAPSAGKTPALEAVTAASRAIEAEEDAAHQAARGNDHDPPPRPRLVVADTTTEALQRVQAGAPRGVVCIRDELAGWIGGFGRYGGYGADRAYWLQCWSGGPYVVDRVGHGDDPIRIADCAAAVIGCMVPDRLREVLAGADDGLAARLMYVWPDPLPIAPLRDAGDTETARRHEMLLRAARRLRGLDMATDRHGGPAPRVLRLDDYARALHQEVRLAALQRARDSAGLAAGWAAKNPGRALRLALVGELLAWAARGDDAPEPSAVTLGAMERAAAYIDYATAMLDRIEGGIAIRQAEVDAAAIARHLRATGAAAIDERALYRTRGWHWLRDDRRRTSALGVLERCGWIRRAAPDGSPGRPRQTWEVSPRIGGESR